MLDEKKVKRLSEVFGLAKIEIRRLLTDNIEEIVLSFDDAINYLATAINDNDDCFDINNLKRCLQFVETTKQWAKIFPLLKKLVPKYGRELIADPIIQWTARAKQELNEASNIVDKVNIYYCSPEWLQGSLRETIVQQAKEFINNSSSWPELFSLTQKLDSRNPISRELVLEARSRLHAVLERTIPNINNTQELWKIRNEIPLPWDMQEQLIRRLYEIME
ncbi:MAG TPA: hypothetical protein PLX67_01815 [bacterium]|mgnify:CR=1 FL=1|jgi:hypothetical protein|nr:hypothetical protein [bacterium]HNZ51288.1 hypothetical protein [bacterium]HOF79913.1 hypothetical protein [bacterium]HOH85658.1 hypothetical protein [bacterium]HOQ91599.1 hypothetical protein [bacterium]